MDDPRLLRDLARTAREEEAEESRRWERWDRLNDGALAPEEEAELRALAATSVEAEQAFEAFRPLSPEFRARMVAKIGPLVKGNAAPEEIAPSLEPPIRVGRPRVGREEERARGFFFPWWRAGFIGSGLATAAAALFLLLRLPALPVYTLAVQPGVITSRGDETAPEGPIVLAPGDPFEAYATPEELLSSREPLDVLGFLVAGALSGGDFQRLETLKIVEPDPGGALRLAGTVPSSQAPGPATLWIVVGYRGKLPRPDELAALPSDRNFQVRYWVAIPRPIEIRAP